MNKLSLLLVTSLLGLAACSPSKKAASANVEIDSACSSGIINGKSVKKADPLAKKVVLLMMADKNKNYSTCTGTPISEDTILTAAHCVKDAVVVSAIFKTALCENDQLKNEEFIIASDWKSHDDYKGVGANDVAVVKLSRSIPADYQVSKIFNGESEITSNTLTLVGFGRTSEEDQGLPQLRKTTKTLRQEVGLVNEPGSDILLIDQQTTGICNGDSGGPVFIEVNYELQVMGVNSFVSNPDDPSKTCHNFGGATFMPPHLKWLGEVTGLNFN
ncbi:trypsin-like serine protease [Bdellovibrio sp. KM01]|uniref:S1 family peptidase n=1 Tax=Bdellovibrio sp. KM01 TaxID=2748865 RepID=UPI0015EA94F3|nr:S1 family peptidase [Bdellovibrio sp. KM01]QLY26246.1 S1 family peptidase [Bdellovibrio sp. KM01]